jgi:hypothetical protein
VPNEEVTASPEVDAVAGEDRAEDSAASGPRRAIELAAAHETGAAAPQATGAQRPDRAGRGGADRFHPIADAWPLLGEPELQELADDIKANDLRHPIVRHRDGSILDGRNRYLACRMAGVECPSTTYEGQDGAELVAFVVSLNEKRRHLTTDQRAAVAAEIANLGQAGRRQIPQLRYLSPRPHGSWA